MRIQDLVIGGSLGGIYKHITSKEDYLNFLALCQKHHPKSCPFDVYGNRWGASEDNFNKYLPLGTACAYISGVSGVIGISPSPEAFSTQYAELTSDSKASVALKYIKSLKE
jgi:hypothetical protein